MKIITFFAKELLYGGHILSIGGVFVALSFMIILGIEINLPIAFGIYLFGQPIFFIDRYVGYKHDLEGNQARTEHIISYRRYILYVVLLYIVLFVILMISSQDYEILLLGLILFSIGALYGIFLKNLTKIIPGFKNIFVALFWAGFGLYVLFPDNFSHITSIFWLWFFYIFLRTLSMQIFFDFKDIKSDSIGGLKTVPVLLGLKKSILILLLVNIFSYLIVLFAVIQGLLPSAMLLLILNHIVSSSIQRRWVKDRNYSFFIINMFEYIVIFLFVLVSYGGVI